MSDITQAHTLLHGYEWAAFGDAGYQGVEMHQENQSRSVTWHVDLRPGKRRALSEPKIVRLRE